MKRYVPGTLAFVLALIPNWVFGTSVLPVNKTPWEYSAATCTNFSGVEPAHCAHLDGGQWINNTVGCVNALHRRPWPTDEFTEARVSSLANEPATFQGWQSFGQTVECIGYFDTAGYTETYGEESSNFGLLTIPSQSALYGTRRDREVSCPEGGSEWDEVQEACVRLDVADPYKGFKQCPLNGTHPVNTFMGEKTHVDTDIRLGMENPLVFKRYYSTRSKWRYAGWDLSTMGYFWRHTYSRRMTYFNNGTDEKATAYRETGDRYYFDKVDLGGGQFAWQAIDADITATLALVDEGGEPVWHYRTPEGVLERYDFDKGQLISLTSPQGYITTLTYDATSGQIDEVSNGFGHSLKFHYIPYNVANTTLTLIDKITVARDGVEIAGSTYDYDYKFLGGSGPNVAVGKVIYPDETPANDVDNPFREYLYNEPDHVYDYEFADIWAGPSGTQGGSASYLEALTGILDENGDRYATYKYKDYVLIGGNHQRLPAGGAHGTTPDASGALPHQYTITQYHDESAVEGPLSHSGDTKIRDAAGTERTFSFELVEWVLRPTTVSGGECTSCNGAMAGTTYDPATGFVVSEVDHAGNKKVYQRNSLGLDVCRIEGVSTVDPLKNVPRRTVTVWDTTFRVPTEERVYEVNGTPNLAACDALDDAGWALHRKTETTYEAGSARVSTRTVRSYEGGVEDETPRTTAYTYYGASDPDGNEYQLKTIDGPRSGTVDMTTFKYATTMSATHTKGDLVETVNALSHSVEILEHDAYGRPTKIEDPNGALTEFSYHPRGWLRTRTVDGQLTTFTYDAVGQLNVVTLPDGSFLNFDYDDAHRLTKVTDTIGNYISYTLDAMGNRVVEETHDPLVTPDSLQRKIARVYDDWNRLKTLTEGAPPNDDHSTHFDYVTVAIGAGVETDLLWRTIDPRDPTPSNPTILVTNEYDALSRVAKVSNPSSIGGETTFVYDVLDNVVSVTDAKGLTTTYETNGFGEVRQVTSPDTGVTSYTYDEAGNRLTEVRAEDALAGRTVVYAYDGLNRLTSIDYEDDTLDVTFSYDETAAGQNGLGRLTTIDDESGLTQYRYDLRGNVIEVSTTRDAIAHTTGYAYNGADRLTQMTYPSGRTVDYVYREVSLGVGTNQIEAVTSSYSGASETLVDGVVYLPFGPIKGWTYGNGIGMTQTHDTAYRITNLNHDTVLQRTMGHDAADNITSVTDHLDAARDQALAYDHLSRLTSATGIYGTRGYQYDTAGNRLVVDDDGTPYTYSYQMGSHRIDQIVNGAAETYTYDANGNTVQHGSSTSTFEYGEDNRLKEAKTSGATVGTYAHDAFGRRTKKSTATDAYFHHGLDGTLLAETDSAGDTVREYAYLQGMPIAVIETAAGTPGTFPAVISLEDIDGLNGFQLDGTDHSDYSSHSAGGAGDVNGDGYDDLIIGADWADPGGLQYAGETYVFFGKAGGYSPSIKLDTLDGTNGFRLDGNAQGEEAGRDVSSAGDVNGDGYDDVIVGAKYHNDNGIFRLGHAYVVFGKASGFPANMAFSTLNGSNGFRLESSQIYETHGIRVAGGGDINGDGYDDLLVSRRNGNTGGLTSAGETYVVFGKAAGFSAVVDLLALNGTDGFRIDGEAASDLSGTSIAFAGDVNADGFDDVVIGALWADPGGDSKAGASYVVFGKASGYTATLSLGALNGTNGFKVSGIDIDDMSGHNVAAAGDINGDGYDDVVIGAHYADPDGKTDAGETYVVFGKAAGFTANIDLATLDGTDGFMLKGIDAGDLSGFAAAGAGDVNDDGVDDLIIGAMWATIGANTGAGETYVLFGRTSGFPAVFALDSLNGTNGFRIDGMSVWGAFSEASGYTVAAAGDVNGDGIDDLLVGAPFADTLNPWREKAGETYVFFGIGGGTSGGTYFVHTDHLATPQLLTDATQQTVWQADYQPFGAANVAPGSVDFNLRFPGQYFDVESGVYQNWHREYDPSIGRYLQSDPIGLDGGINTYAYAVNNPIASFDPLGLSPCFGPVDDCRRIPLCVERDCPGRHFRFGVIPVKLTRLDCDVLVICEVAGTSFEPVTNEDKNAITANLGRALICTGRPLPYIFEKLVPPSASPPKSFSTTGTAG